MISSKHILSLRLLHWLMALMFASLIFAGLTMVQSLATWQPSLLMLHKSFGLLALLLFFVRLIIKLTNKQILPELEIAPIQKRAAHLVHFLLYCLMLLIPVSGFLSQYFASKPISFFGLFKIGVSSETNIVLFSVFRESHSLLVGLFVVLILMHSGAALYHHFIAKDDTLKRML
ncbi:cytochrome b [Pseudoalteromonas sp. SSM20]|uniref:cytochrome b n=1 Tax=Pseudoalteromonas sp. SSM20 TaxID=3139394 RepID=UPI003BABACE3